MRQAPLVHELAKIGQMPDESPRRINEAEGHTPASLVYARPPLEP